MERPNSYVYYSTIIAFAFLIIVIIADNTQADPSSNPPVLQSVHVDDVLEYFSRSGFNLVADTYVEMNFWHNVPLPGKTLEERMQKAADDLGYEVKREGKGKAYVWQFRQWFLKGRIPKDFVQETLQGIKQHHPGHLTHEIKAVMEVSSKGSPLTLSARSVLTEVLVKKVSEESRVKMRVERELAKRRITLFMQKVSLEEFREWVAKALRAKWNRNGKTYVLFQDVKNKREELKALAEYEREMQDKTTSSWERLRNDIRDSLLESLGSDQLALLRAEGRIEIAASALSFEQRELIRRLSDRVNQMAEKQGLEHRIDPWSLERIEMKVGPDGKIRYTCYGRLYGGMATAF